MPFRTLQRFGIQFLNKFSVSQLPAPILESITFVDTPGILSGEKQRMGRLYDFAKVVEQVAFCCCCFFRRGLTLVVSKNFKLLVQKISCVGKEF